MNGFVFIILFICVQALELVKREGSVNEDGKFWNPVNQILGHDSSGSSMNSTVYMSVNNFNCMVEEIQEPNTLLYGTKSWTFPIQDVNLTLSYPVPNSAQVSGDDEGGYEGGYLIVGFKVIIYIDGVETRGYITNGGIMKDTIVLSFVSSNISTLSYQFWLFGMPHNKSSIVDQWLNHNFDYLCQ